VRTILLLTISNIFMTFAWYGHLKYRNEALSKVIIASWGIAFFEYCFQVPANRIGSYRIQHRAAQDHPGSDYTDGVRNLLGHLPWRKIEVELRRRRRVFGARCVFCLPQMVMLEINGLWLPRNHFL